jgi:hypothetical protein
MTALNAAHSLNVLHALKRAFAPVITTIVQDNLNEPLDDIRRKINEAILPYFTGTPFGYTTVVESESIYIRVSENGRQVAEMRIDISCTDES